MANKSAFTLAEVLITIGIVGVVAALSTPMIIHSISNAQVLPKLSKFKNTFDNATRRLLVDEGSDTILGIDDLARANHNNGNRTEEFYKKIQSYMKLEPAYDNYYNTFVAKGYNNPNTDIPPLFRQYKTEKGEYFRISIVYQRGVKQGFPNIPAYQRIGTVHLDINGPKGPNLLAKDVFWFSIYNDGTLRPSGGDGTPGSADDPEPRLTTWRGGNCDETGVHAPHLCAGSVFDNGKVIYNR